MTLDETIFHYRFFHLWVDPGEPKRYRSVTKTEQPVNHRPELVQQAKSAYDRLKAVPGHRLFGQSPQVAWLDEEGSMGVHIGTPNYSTAIATIYAVEAARHMCSVRDEAALVMLDLARERLAASIERGKAQRQRELPAAG